MARSNVPKFGNWEGKSDVPYTVYFDTARRNRGGRMINPNDIQGNPDIGHDVAPAAAPQRQPITKPEEINGRRHIRPSPEQSMNRESIQYRQLSNPQPPSVNVPSEQSYGRRGQRPTGSGRLPGAGNDQSFERSPLHLQQQGKEVRPNRSPILEDVKYGNAPVAPAAARSPLLEDVKYGNAPAAARSRQRSVPPRNESPDRATAVPIFGDWNENDPRSANFTGRFNRVREERNAPPAPAPNAPPRQLYSPHVQQPVKPKACCFPW